MSGKEAREWILERFPYAACHKGRGGSWEVLSPGGVNRLLKIWPARETRAQAWIAAAIREGYPPRTPTPGE